MNKELDRCLVCGNDDLRELINLGDMPLANNLKDSAQSEDIKYPLIVNECPICTHKQLSIAVDPKILFSNYLYQTGTSQIHRDFFKQITRVISNKGIGNVLDIGCNDGSLLKEFKNLGWEVLGIEPSYRLADQCDKDGIEVINEYFPIKDTSYGTFDVITAFNVFAHNNDPLGFLLGMADILNPNGRIYIITTPASLPNFYHEHISYFTPLSMNLLTCKCDLELNSFVVSPMHGKSYLFELSHKKEILIPSKDTLKGWLGPFVGYGASAGATVLLNYYGFNLEYIVDDTQAKQGKYVPGVNIPICDSKRLELDPRDLTIVITAFNLFDEIKSKIIKLRPHAQDTFINPLTGKCQ